MSAVAPPPAVPAAEPAPSAIGRIVGAIVSPGETFASIARRPTWLAPMLLWTAISLGTTAALLPRIDYEKVTRDSLERQHRTLPEDQMPAAIEQARKFSGIFGWGFGAIGPALAALFTAVVCWGSFKAFGWDTKFSQAFGVTAHAFLPDVLKYPFVIFLIRRQESVDPNAIGDLLRSNLGFLVARDSSKALHSVLLSLDVFSLWCVALFVIGMAAAAKIKRGPAAGVILTLWVLGVAIGAAWKAMF